MPLYRVQTSLKGLSGLPEDDTVMTHYFSTVVGNDLTTTEMDELGGAIASAFNNSAAPDPEAPATTYTPTQLLSPQISRSVAPKFKVYKLDSFIPGQDWGSPAYEGAWAGIAATVQGDSLPREVAVCASFHGNLIGVDERDPEPPLGPGGDVLPRARRRGRTFWGPLNRSADKNGPTSRPAPRIRAALNLAMTNLAANANLVASGATWVVLSQVSGGTAAVVGGWVDDEWDTQRRRGLQRTVRDRWGVGF